MNMKLRNISFSPPDMTEAEIAEVTLPLHTRLSDEGCGVCDFELRGYHSKLRGMKRLFDVLMSELGLLVLSPLFLVLAVWIKLDSPGPVFYRPYATGYIMETIN